MRHVAADQGEGMARRRPLRGEIRSLENAVAARQSETFEFSQVLDGRAWANCKRQRRRIGGNDSVSRKPAPEAEPRDAEGVILVVFVRVERGIRRFGKPPWNAAAQGHP